MTPEVACGGKDRPLLAKAPMNSSSGLAMAGGVVASAMRANTVVANPPIANFMIGPVHVVFTRAANTADIHMLDRTSKFRSVFARTLRCGRKPDRSRLESLRDLDVDLVDAGPRGRHTGVAVARGRQRTQRPGAGRGEEPEVTGGRRDDLGGELVGGVQQAHDGTADRLARTVDDATGDHCFLLEVDAGRQRQSLLRC